MDYSFAEWYCTSEERTETKDQINKERRITLYENL